VKLVRGGSSPSDTVGKQNFELNMVDILESGKTEKDVVLQPDDFIIVPVLIALSIKLIPPTVLNDAREQLKNNPQRYKKNNWLFAALIIIIWLSILYIIVFWIRGRMLISS